MSEESERDLAPIPYFRAIVGHDPWPWQRRLYRHQRGEHPGGDERIDMRARERDTQRNSAEADHGAARKGNQDVAAIAAGRTMQMMYGHDTELLRNERQRGSLDATVTRAENPHVVPLRCASRRSLDSQTTPAPTQPASWTHRAGGRPRPPAQSHRSGRARHPTPLVRGSLDTQTEPEPRARPGDHHAKQARSNHRAGRRRPDTREPLIRPGRGQKTARQCGPDTRVRTSRRQLARAQ